MNRAWKHLAGNIFNGAEPGSVSIEEIDILLSEYPYFAGLHLLKAIKLKDDNSREAVEARSRAALYFQNPHWYQTLLTELGEAREPVVKEVHEVVTDGAQPAEPISVVEEMQEAETSFDDRRIEPGEQWETALAENPVFQYQQPSDEEAFEQNQWQNQQEVGSPNEPEAIIADEVAEEDAVNVEEDEIPSVSEEEVTTIVETAIVEDATEEAEDFPEPAEGTEVKEEVPPVVAEGPADVEELKKELTVEIPFEPLYTIDYFASQGIKYANEADKDQLSVKLKSFTEWLKSMKRLHPEKVQHSMDNSEEAVVRESAESSNEKQSVLTEAMAEVYLKQGSREKAVEIYEKLSLLDPSKSAYFAVRIKEIKGY